LSLKSYFRELADKDPQELEKARMRLDTFEVIEDPKFDEAKTSLVPRIDLKTGKVQVLPLKLRLAARAK
jgi:hypothetical protein